MKRPVRRTLLLPHSVLEHGFSVARLLSADPDRSWAAGYRLLREFELTPAERRFALELLRRKPNLWLYRCNQRAFSGDFIAVDMSPSPAYPRPAFVLELKQDARLTEGVAGIQMAEHRLALEEIADLPAPVSSVTLLCGSGEALLARLGAC